jgi:hypothetical protein
MVFRIYLQSNSKVSLEYPSDHKRITEKVITDTEPIMEKSI